MKVRCIDSNGFKGFLTVDKIYEVIKDENDLYLLTLDDGEETGDWVLKNRFEVVEDDTTQPLSSPMPESCMLKVDNPLNVQIAGNHYKTLKIQPVEYAHANKLDFFQGSVVKYVTRFRSKNGKQDLEKAKHVIDMLIKLEYGEGSNNE